MRQAPHPYEDPMEHAHNAVVDALYEVEFRVGVCGQGSRVRVKVRGKGLGSGLGLGSSLGQGLGSGLRLGSWLGARV